MISGITKGVLDWFSGLLTKLGEWVIAKLQAYIAEQKRRKEIKEKAGQSVDPLKKAQTAADIDSAVDVALDDF